MDFAADWRPMTQHQNEVLDRSSFFRFLPEDRADCLRAVLQEEHFEFGDVIVREGDEADACYILVNGRARVVKEIKEGQEVALAVLRPGDQFGEQALIAGGCRNATVRCSTAVDALRLNRADFLSLLTEHPDLKTAVELTSRHRTLHGFLHEFSNFGRLPERALRTLVEKMTPVAYARGATILREGDPAGPLFVIESGRVRIFTQSNGRQKNVAFYRDGDFFGELSILNGSQRAASVEAVADCRLLALQPESVREMKEQFPEFRKLLEERLAQYQADVVARVPLDFAEELLPAETRVQDKVALDERAAGAVRRQGRPVPSPRQETHPPHPACAADRRDGLWCGQPGNDLPALRSQGKSFAHPRALPHVTGRHQPEGDLPCSRRTGACRPHAQGFATESSEPSDAGDRPLGREPLDGPLRCDAFACESG